MNTKAKRTSDALEIVHRRYYKGRPRRVTQLEEERANDQLARRLLELREEAGLTQRQIADLIGTTPSVISRLEDSTYEGHSLAMLRRVAAALNKSLEIRFVAKKPAKLRAA